MRNHSYNIKLVGGVEKRDPNVSIPGTWSKQTNQNIKESQGNFLDSDMKIQLFGSIYFSITRRYKEILCIFQLFF